MSGTPPILYAEDDENDAFLMKRACRVAGFVNPLVVVRNGAEAINYLAGAGSYGNRETHPLPLLALLDIKMPLGSGLEVLTWIRSILKSDIPVIVLTSSNQMADIEKAYQEGANAFLVKPGHPEQLVNMMKGIKSFWLGGG